MASREVSNGEAYMVNAFHAASECRRHVNNVTNFVKNVKIVEFHDPIWNGSVNREIAVTISEMSESKHVFSQ